MPARLEHSFCIRGNAKRFVNKLVRQPLMVDPWRVDRLLNVHVVIDDIRDHLQYGIDNGWASGTAYCKPEQTVLAQHKRWRHRREGALARPDGVVLALNQSVGIWRPRLGGEIVHLIV